jgi:SAM-dependent methyltransferase
MVTDELWDLETLKGARRLGDWMFEQFRPHVRGSVAEVGAGIGTFSERILAAGARDLLLVEPEPACAERLRRDFGADPRVTVAAETLPDAPALRARAGTLDHVVCQNVLEHIDDDFGAVAAMAAALRPGGVLSVLVPAHPWLYGPLDEGYGHARRYTRRRLGDVVRAAGLEVLSLERFNALGIAGWVVKNRTRDPRIDPRSLQVYERVVPAWRALESRVRLPVGLSVIVHARCGAPGSRSST